MQTFVVGGWVRDALLREAGRTLAHASDRDWVVVGATPDEMLARGFRPVGRDFPVFLHPETHEEYALARTERKTAPGYRGFVVHSAPDVTLEQDLSRRDLTINAIARAGDGTLIDPFQGRQDLRAGVLRHVGPAFVEDPVRILRLARFAARFADFTVHPDTRALLRAMVQAGEADALVPERVWQELSRGLMEARPSRMIEVLVDCGLVARSWPLLSDPSAAARAADRAADAALALPQRVAAMVAAGCGKAGGEADAQGVRQLLGALRADAHSLQLAVLLATHRAALGRPAPAEVMARVLEQCDAVRRPERCAELLAACRALDPTCDTGPWERALAAVRAVDAGAIARAHGPGAPDIAAALSRARQDAIGRAIAPSP